MLLDSTVIAVAGHRVEPARLACSGMRQDSLRSVLVRAMGQRPLAAGAAASRKVATAPEASNSTQRNIVCSAKSALVGPACCSPTRS